MTTTEIAQRSPAVLARLSAVNAKVTELLAQIPTGESDGGAGIYEQLLAAENPEDLNRPWENQGLEAYKDQRIIVDVLSKLESDFKDGPGWFLLGHGAAEKTGEEITFTTSSLATMIQLVKAFEKGWMPLTCIPRVSERKTESGYEAWHLEIIPPGAPRPGDNLRRMRERTAAAKAEQAPADEPGF